MESRASGCSRKTTSVYGRKRLAAVEWGVAGGAGAGELDRWEGYKRAAWATNDTDQSRGLRSGAKATGLSTSARAATGGSEAQDQ